MNEKRIEESSIKERRVCSHTEEDITCQIPDYKALEIPKSSGISKHNGIMGHHNFRADPADGEDHIRQLEPPMPMLNL